MWLDNQGLNVALDECLFVILACQKCRKRIALLALGPSHLALFDFPLPSVPPLAVWRIEDEKTPPFSCPACGHFEFVGSPTRIFSVMVKRPEGEGFRWLHLHSTKEYTGNALWN